jgi:hypothetical protein
LVHFSGQKRRVELGCRHEKTARRPFGNLADAAPLPGWIVSAPAETFEAAAFRSGAALAHLGLLATASQMCPRRLWRDRLALAAAEVAWRIAGRREGPERLA